MAQGRLAKIFRDLSLHNVLAKWQAKRKTSRQVITQSSSADFAQHAVAIHSYNEVQDDLQGWTEEVRLTAPDGMAGLLARLTEGVSADNL